MREITIKINDKDYLNFQTVANESGLKVDEKISQIFEKREISKRISSIMNQL